jgi:hypothetical protein
MRRLDSPARPSASPRSATYALGGLALLSFGCSVSAEEYSTTEVRGSTQAVLQVQREEGLEGARGDALVGFIRLPASADRTTALAMAGFLPELPAPGQCRLRATSGDAHAVSELSRIELLDANSVELRTSTGSHELAPHAFPTVTDWIRGVVHASRDRDAALLPSGDGYRLLAKDIEELGALDVAFSSPELPSEVTVGGLPWASTGPQRASGYLDLTWSPSTMGTEDSIWVVLETAGQQRSCSFADSDGAGSVPLDPDGGAPFVAPGSEARLAVHRVRQSSASPHGFSLVTARFDFALTKSVDFE